MYFCKSQNCDGKKAGSFPDYISDSEKYNIDSLTISGPLNGTDIGWICDMAGSSVQGRETKGSLRYIDTTNNQVVAGDSSYFNGTNGALVHVTYYTANDTIGPCMFTKCKKLEHILLPNTAKSTSNRSFESCNNLKSVVIPNSFETIEWYSFQSYLESLYISNSLSLIEEKAFYYCRKLNDIYIFTTKRPEEKTVPILTPGHFSAKYIKS